MSHMGDLEQSLMAGRVLRNHQAVQDLAFAVQVGRSIGFRAA